MLVRCLVFILLLGAVPALAQSDGTSPAARAQLEAQIRSVESALSRVTAEQQSVYQQFQMVQEMRRSALQEMQGATQAYTPPSSPPNYDDVQREREARDARLQGYSAEMDRLYARYQELEEQKRPLLDELADLTGRR